MNRKELLDCPLRDWDGDIKHAVGVYIIPTKKKHESGCAIMSFVALTKDGKRVRFGGRCDDVSLKGSNFRIDCDFQTKLVHIWNRNPFSITHDLSSIDFIEEVIKYE